MQEINQQVVATIVTAIILLLAIAVIMLLLAVYYTNTKKRLIREKEILKATYEQTILKTQLEIQEQTFHNVSQEIHDNIGQVLSFVKLNLGTAAGLTESEKDEKITESKDLVAQAIGDLRDLSKSLSFDHISANGFIHTIKTEVQRINKSKLVGISFKLEGEYYSLGEQRELVLFRIMQESVNNALKHSGAKHLTVSLQYTADLFTLTVLDDGSGFDHKEAMSKNGSGLKNIKNRAGLIGAEYKINSAVGRGSEIIVTLNPVQQKIYVNPTHTSSLN
ncbi:sensor histidine kinase [Mucilaginibacter sp. AW1-3]